MTDNTTRQELARVSRATLQRVAEDGESVGLRRAAREELQERNAEVAEYQRQGSNHASR